MELVILGTQSVQEEENSDLKQTGTPGWGFDIGLTPLFLKKKHPCAEIATEEIMLGVMGLQNHRKILV